ncbi:MAG: hypothetical protein GY856_22435 [bacterium]|nr:hypothetical protein [bacterium]
MPENPKHGCKIVVSFVFWSWKESSPWVRWLALALAVLGIAVTVLGIAVSFYVGR